MPQRDIVPVVQAPEQAVSVLRQPLVNIDLRSDGKSEPVLSAGRIQAVAEFKKGLPDVAVDFDPVTKSPKWVGASTRLLTDAQTGLAAKDADAPVRQFIAANRGLFGHGPEVLDTARRVTDYSTARGPSRKVVWHQQLDGIEIFEAVLQANLTTNSALINIGSQMMPEPQKALDAATRAAMAANPAVTVEKAVAAAGGNVGEKIQADGVRPMAPPAVQPDKRQQFRAAMLTDAEVKLIWVPMDEKTLRLAWDVTLTSRSRAEMYRVLVDSQTSEVLVRQALTAYISPSSYRVYTKESPTPFSPGHEIPSSLQPLPISRELITLDALDTTASPNGWINDGINITSGNNTDTYTDVDDTNTPDLPRTTGSPNRVFDFPMDLTQTPANLKDASNTQLFYWTNFMHDRLYQLGFTEAAGNFQIDNFGRGGSGNDPVNAEAQDGSGTNNANFSTPVDGGRGRMQMYLWTSPTPDRDGSFEAEVVLHEYAHGLSNRLVGGPSVTISNLSTRGMGEGWSDFYGLALTAEASDNPHGNWARGGWSRYLSSNWLSENYYYGARRYSYSTDMLKNPHTLRDIDPNLVDWHTSLPRNPTYAATQDASQVHYQGTVWCVMLWDLRANLILKHGFNVGAERALFLVTEGMKLGPANPNFVQSRDGIIQATLVNHPGDLGEVWTAFAKRGIGFGATAPVSTTTTGIVESFSVPDSLEISNRSGWNIRGNKGGPFTPVSQTVMLSNDGASTFNWSGSSNANWLTISPGTGTLAAGASVVVTVTTQAEAMEAGFHSSNVVFTNTTSGFNQPIGIRLYVTPPVAQSFDLSTNPGWTTTGEWAYGPPSGNGGASAGGSGNADPSAGATGSNIFGVNLGGNASSAVGGPFYLTSAPVNLATHKNTRLRFMRWLNTNALANARVTVEVSTNGANWREVFVNPGTSVTDNAWTLMDYDISSFADRQAAVQVRWSYQNVSSPGFYSNWNIDDVQFLGEQTTQFSLSFNEDVTEGVGQVSATLNVNAILPEPLTISLSSSDPSAATVLAAITMDAGSTSKIFFITPVNDPLLEGSQTTLITASAPGISSGTRELRVHDNETAVLSLSMAANLIEGATNLSGSLSVSAAPARDVLVVLSSDNAALSLPASVIIPAGSNGPVNFTFSAPDNAFAEGAKAALVTASVTNWTGASSNVLVTDDDVPTILITGSPSGREGGGPQTYTATVNTIQLSPLTVNLGSNDSSELTVSATVVIPIGQFSADFNATIIDDPDKDGAQVVTITGSRAGYLSGMRAVTIEDSEVASYAFATIASPQKRNKAFAMAVTARDINGVLITNHSGGVMLASSSASGPVPFSPAAPVLFVNGTATETVTVTAVATGMTMTATDATGNTGTSNAFDVVPVVHDRFVWSGLPSGTINADTLFNATSAAVDDQGGTYTSYQDITTLDLWMPAFDRTVGTGTGVTSKIFNTAAHDARAQMIFTAAELGSTPRWIGGISLSLSTTGGQAMSNTTIRMKPTDRADFVGAGWDGGGWQTVYSNASLSASGAFIMLTQPYYYDGVRNVMLDFSFNGSSASTTGTLRFTPRSNRLLSGTSNSTEGDPLLWSGTLGPSPQISDEVPNVSFYEARHFGQIPNSPVSFNGGTWSGQTFAPGTTVSSSMWLRALAPSGVTGFSDRLVLGSINTSPVGANTVFSDGFETGVLGATWNTTGSTGTTPRTQVTSLNTPKTGNYHLTMDNSNNVTGTFARNSPTLTLNLAGRRNVSVEWFAKSFLDDGHTPTLTGPQGAFGSSMNYDGVAISQDGANWVEVSSLRSLSSIYGASATRVVLDPVIQRLGWSFNSIFQIRFSQYDDQAISNDGIGIDDVAVKADATNAISLSLPATINEGTASVTFTVNLSSAPASDTVVTLTSSAPMRFALPSSVIVLAGQTSVTAEASAPQNLYADGGRAVHITASAAGQTTGYTHTRIVDDEQAVLSLTLPASITEGGSSGTGTFTISPPPLVSTNVFFSSSNSAQATATSSASLGAGITSGTFSISPINDLLIDGTQSVTITVSAPGMVSGSTSIDVQDNESTQLQVTPPATLVEGGATGVGTISISGMRAVPTMIALSSSDTSEAIVPGSVVIPAGQTSVNFQATPVEDALQDGAQSVILTASAAGFVEGTASFTVRDNDPNSFAFSSIASPQIRNVEIPVTITAQDENNQTLTDFHGTATLTASGGMATSTSAPLSFVSGVWTGGVRLGGAGTGITLSVTGTDGATGISNPFDVNLGGAATALSFAAIPSLLSAGAVLPVQISAVDAGGVLVNEASGSVTVELRSSPGNAVIFTTTTMLVNGSVTISGLTVPGTAAAVYLHATAGALVGQTPVFAVTAPSVIGQTLSPVVLFQDGFESGLKPQWSITGTGTHRTVISSANTPLNGAKHLVMDSSVDGSLSRNEATLTLNLAGEKGVELSFWMKEFGDEDNGPPTAPFTNGGDFDGIAISADGVTWYEVQGLRSINGITSNYKQFTLNLSAAAANFGLVFNSTFKIRFNHYDDYAVTTDGFAFDDILLRANAFQTPEPVVSVFEEDFESGTFQPQWQISGTGLHRTLISSSQAPRGGQHLLMDVHNFSSARNEATLSIDLSGLQDLTLKFWMKEFSDDDHGPPTSPFTNGSDFDGVAISADGVTWYEVQGLRSSNGISTAYQEFTVDLSAAATSRGLSIGPDFKIRFNHYDDNPLTSDGFAFDDIRLTSRHVEQLTLNVPVSITEGGGGNAVVTLPAARSVDTVVQLSSNRPGQLSLPATVTIFAGQTSSAPFSLQAAEDNVLAGSQQVEIIAEAGGFRRRVVSLVLADNESVPGFDLNLSAGTLAEGGSISGSVSYTGGALLDLGVALSAMPSIGLSFPPGLTLPAGTLSVGFTLGKPENDIILEPASTLITSSAGTATESSSLLLTDNDASTPLIIALPASVSESGGPVTGTVGFAAPTTTGIDLVVTLGNNNSTAITVPASVTIPAGSGSVTFTATPQDNVLFDGTRNATLTASVMGLIGDAHEIAVLDDELHHIAISSIASPQVITQPFSVTLRAVAIDDVTLPTFTGAATLTAASGSIPVSLTPGVTAAFVGGVWTGPLTFPTAAANVILTASATGGLTGISNSFDVTNGPDLAISQPSLSAATLQNELPVNRTLSLSNTGTGTLNWSAAVIGSAPWLTLSPSSGSIIEGGAANVTVNFTPGVLSPAVYTATLRLTSNAPATPQQDVPLTFTVSTGVHHFDWSTIPSPQVANIPFAATVTAKNSAGSTLAGFQGSARLSFVSAPVDTTSGTETGQYAHPFFLSAYSEYRTQYIYLPSEVGAAGRIETIACNVSNTLGAVNNFTVRFKHTTKASYTGTGQAVWESTGWTTVYQANQPATGAGGWFVMPLTVPFEYDGIQNLMVDFSYDNATTVTSSATHGTSKPTARTLAAGTSGNSSGSPVSWSGTSPTPTTYTGLTNIRFTRRNVATASPSVVTFTSGVWSGALSAQSTGTALAGRVEHIPNSAVIGTSNTFDITAVGTLSLTVPASGSEGGTLNATVTASIAPASDLVVYLSSSDTTEATLPASVTILAGQTSTAFDITLMDDTELDGTQTASLSANAPGHSRATANVSVQDADTTTVTLTLPAFMTENTSSTAGAASVQLGTVAAADLTITLGSSLTSRVTVPASIIIPAGQSSVSFILTAPNTSVIDGTQTATITATLAGSTPGAATINILDDESRVMNVFMNYSSLSEGGLSQTNAGYVSLSGTVPAPLTINLASSDTTEATIPATVTISTGSSTGYFTVTPVNDALFDGSQSVTITASVPTYTGNPGVITILDDDVHHFGISNVTGQVRNKAFSITATAQDINNVSINTYTGNPVISAAQGVTPLGITPTNLGAFTSSSKTASVTIADFATSAVITASDSAGGIAGSSNAFAVVSGPFTRFGWSSISSPQEAEIPFSTTVTALDDQGNTASFTGTAALSVATEVAVGKSETTWFVPLSSVYPRIRTQVIYTAAELGNAKTFNSMALNVSTLPGSMSAFTVRLRHIPKSDYTGTGNATWESTGWTVCHPAATKTITLTGWHVLNFATPFAYNGSDNIMVDISYANAGYGSTFGYIRATNATAQRSLYHLGDTISGDPLSWSGTTPTPTATTLRPDIRLGISLPSIPSISPTTTGSFVAGVWTGNITVSAQSPGIELQATSGTSIGRSNAFSVSPAPPRLTLTVPASAYEIAGTVSGTLSFNNPQPSAHTVNLSSSDTTALQFAASVIIPANTLSVPITLNIINDALKDGAQNVTLTADIPGVHSTTASVNVLDDELNDFLISTITNPQIRNAPFSLTITARSIDGLTLMNYSNSPVLAAIDGGSPLAITPFGPISGFSNGVKTFNVSSDSFANAAVLSITDGVVTSGSNTFVVGTGPHTRFAWSAIASPQEALTPFSATLTAQDAHGNAITAFTGSAALSLVTTPGPQILPAMTGNFTAGVWTGSITLASKSDSLALNAAAGAASGQSNTFTVWPPPPQITLTLPASAYENAGTASGTLSFDNAQPVAYLVNLSSSDTAALEVPASITVPAFTSSVPVTLTLVNDALKDGAQNATLTATIPGVNTSSASLSVLDDELHDFHFATIPSPQVKNGLFNITIVARSFDGLTLPSYAGTPVLSAASGGAPVAFTSSGALNGFISGSKSLNISISDVATEAVLTATDGATTGSSNPFEVQTSGIPSRFSWSTIPALQIVDQDIPATVTAQDSQGNPTPGFTGMVTLNAEVPRFVGVANNLSEQSLSTNFNRSRSQQILHASEVGSAGQIISLAININDLGVSATLTDFTIRMKHTNRTSYSGAAPDSVWESAGFTTVYQGSPVISGTGKVVFSFSTPFNFDGTRNLMIDFSHRVSTASGGTASLIIATSYPGQLRSIHFATNSATNGDPLAWDGTIPVAQPDSRVADVQLGFSTSASLTPSSLTFSNGVWAGNIRLGSAAQIFTLRATSANSAVQGISGNFEVASFMPVLNPEPAFTGGLTNTLQWVAPAAGLFYQVQRSTTPNFLSPVSSSFITTTLALQAGLLDGQRYYYRLRMRRIGSLPWISDWSPAMSSTQDATPPVVTSEIAVTAASRGLITGNATDMSGLSLVNVAGTPASTADAFAHWSGQVSGLATGSNAITITAYDGAVPPNTATTTATIVRTSSNTLAAPIIHSQLRSQWVVLGRELRLSPIVLGSRPLKYEWRKDGKIILGANGPELVIPTVKNTDAGSYQVVVSNQIGGTVSSHIAQVAIITPPGPLLTVKNGGSVKLACAVALPKAHTASFAWSRVGSGVGGGDGILASGAVISGGAKSSCTLSKLNLLEAGTWECSVGLISFGSIGASIQVPAELRVLSVAPVLSPLPSPMEVWVSQQLDLTLSATEFPTSFTATGLPTGLTLDKITGHLTGRVTAASKFDTKTGQPIPSIIKFTATNAVGTSLPIELRLIVKDHFGLLAGNYQGFADRNPVTNFNHGGLADLTLAKTGIATGSFTLAGQKHSFLAPVKPLDAATGGFGIAAGEMVFPLPRTKPAALGDLSVALTLTPTDGTGWMDDLQFAPPGFTTTHGDGTPGTDDDAADDSTAARFHTPQGISIDPEGFVSVADSGNNLVRLLHPRPGLSYQVSTFTSSTINGPETLHHLPGLGFLVGGDAAIHFCRITGVVENFAGSPGQPGHADGSGSNARFRSPSGMCMDPVGNIYVADRSSHVIRKVTLSGTVTTLAGKPDTPGNADGTGSKALFHSPRGILYEPLSKTLLVADTDNAVIRRVTLTGVVTTYLGSPDVPGDAPGIGINARLNRPIGIASNERGTLFITDGGLWQISPAGIAVRISQAASENAEDQPAGIVYDPSTAQLLVTYPAGHRIEQISLPPLPAARADSQFTIARAPLSTGIPVGIYNASLTPNGGTDPYYPQGHGHASLTISSKAAVTFAGRLPDGQSWTAAAPLTHGRQFFTNAQFYKGTSSIHGAFSLDSSGALGGSNPLTWLKLPQPLSPPTVSYPGGFDLQLVVAGGLYTPGNLHTYLGLASSPATLSFNATGGGLTPFSQPFTLTAPTTLKVSTPNPQTLTLSVTPATGVITGKFQFGTPARTGAFSGLLLDDGTKRGIGHFLLPESTAKEALIQSGQMMIDKP